MAASRKEAWQERAKEIYEKFPEVETFDWNTALAEDGTFFALVLRDMIKLDSSAPGRSGPRPTLERADAQEQLDQIFGRDFSLEPFRQALEAMANGASVRSIANRTGLNRNTVHRLRVGEIEPDPWHMEQLARGWGKHPSYFLEWRILYIAKAIATRLEANPESSIRIFKQMDEQARNS